MKKLTNSGLSVKGNALVSYFKMPFAKGAHIDYQELGR